MVDGNQQHTHPHRRAAQHHPTLTHSLTHSLNKNFPSRKNTDARLLLSCHVRFSADCQTPGEARLCWARLVQQKQRNLEGAGVIDQAHRTDAP